MSCTCCWVSEWLDGVLSVWMAGRWGNSECFTSPPPAGPTYRGYLAGVGSWDSHQEYRGISSPPWLLYLLLLPESCTPPFSHPTPSPHLTAETKVLINLASGYTKTPVQTILYYLSGVLHSQHVSVRLEIIPWKFEARLKSPELYENMPKKAFSHLRFVAGLMFYIIALYGEVALWN